MSHRYFTSRVEGAAAFLEGEEAAHLARVLRARPGQTVILCDGAGTDYEARVEEARPDLVRLTVISSRASESEAALPVTLYVGMPKGDKLDTVIQKAVECGVAAIIPFESSRCIMRAKPETEERKTQRRARIAEEAAKQSRRGLIPEVMPTVTDYAAVLRQAAACDLALFCYEGEGTRSLRTVLDGFVPPAGRVPTVAIVIGSEGGFSPEEADAASDAGLCLCGLGRRILRTETASGFVLSCLAYRFEL